LFTALPCGLFALLRTKHRPRAKHDKPVEALLLAVSFASLIGAGEYARSLFFNGVTSLSLGYALVDETPPRALPRRQSRKDSPEHFVEKTAYFTGPARLEAEGPPQTYNQKFS